MKKKTTTPTDRPLWMNPTLYRKLGQVPDTHVAELAGVHRSTVARWRRRYGISSWCPGRRKGLFQ